MRIIIFSWALCGMITGATWALSDETSTEEADRTAEAAYESGKTAFAERRYVESAADFRKAYELRPSWKILYNIGQAEAAAKRYGFALEAFEQYLADGGDDVDAERQDAVLKEIERLRNLVGYVHIGAPSGASVSVDGVTVGLSPINREIPVAATVQHVVKATKDNAVLSEQTVEVNGGRTVNVDLTQTVPDKAAPGGSSQTVAEEKSASETPSDQNPEAVPNHSKMSKLRLAGIIAASSGGALLIAGAVTGGLAMSKNGTLEKNCSDNICPNGTDMSAQDQRDTLALSTDILIPVGAAAAAAGVALIIVDAIRNKKEKAKTALWFSPSLMPNNAGLVLEGRF